MADWSGAGKLFILLGAVLLLIGLALTVLGKWPGSGGLSWLGRLPGDLVVKRDNFSFYFPLTTSLLISIALTLVFYLVSRR